MRAAIFCRVSTVEQAKKGYSLPEQIATCRARALELGCSHVDEFCEDESGAFLETPGLEALREALKVNEYKYVIMLDPDRLARNLVRQLVVANEIERAGAELVFVHGEYASTPEGRLFFSIRGAISEYEREKIKQRTQSGLRRKALSGKIPRNARPYGYAFDKEQSKYIVDKEEAKVIRHIFTWIGKEKATLYEVCRRLAAMGVPTKRGGAWRTNTVAGIVHNTIYKGEAIAFRRSKKKVAPGKYDYGYHPEDNWITVPVPAIVTEEEFEAAQQTLKENYEKAPRNTKNPYLLQGLVYCPVCHHKMGIAYDDRVTIAYFFCRTGTRAANKEPRDPRCGIRFVPMHHLEAAITEEIMRLVDNPAELRQQISREEKLSNKDKEIIAASLENIQQKMESLKKERERISWLFRKGLIDEVDTERQLKEVAEEEKLLKTEIRDLENKLAGYQKAAGHIDDFISQYMNAFQGFDQAPYFVQRALLQKFIERIYVRRIDRAYDSSKCKLEINIQYRI